MRPRTSIQPDPLIELLRWLSAGVVASTHLRDLLFIDTQESVFAPHANLPAFIGARLFYFITSMGTEAVVVFFVISGYLVGGKLLVDADERANLPVYFINRFSRIYIVLLPALALTLILDLGGAGLAQGSLIYDSTGWSVTINRVIADAHGFGALACNALNLQGLLCKPFGSNGALWSLAFEWFYYLTFPFILTLSPFALRSPTPWSTLVWLAGVVVLVAVFPTFSWWYPIWLMGVLARLGFERRWISINLNWMLVPAALVLAAIGRNHGPFTHYNNFLVGLAVMGMLMTRYRISVGDFGSRLHATLASFSYSLYVLHQPLCVFATAALLSSGLLAERQPLTLRSLAMFGAVLASVYLCAWLFSLATERRTKALRTTIERLTQRWTPLKAAG
jgi:peptidoglycan/LPS O-acetylase OafA/YrhL